MKYLIILCLIFISGCVSTIEPFTFTESIGRNPYQWVGGWEEDKDFYVTRILINKGWIKKIKRDKYYYEIELIKPKKNRFVSNPKD